MKRFFMMVLLIGLLVACNQAAPAPTPATAVVETEATPAPTETPVPEIEPSEPTATAEAATETDVPATEPVEPTAVPELQPIEVTYFTPSQQEGPYYTVNKPEDRDNDLVDFTGASGPPSGQILEFGGTVYGADGLPLPGITIEIWQTDANGVYLHPNDPGTNGRDPNFQFYGEAVTGADGRYTFRTILPGLYEPRPRHIHVKVKQDGRELLTTQFYFASEIDLQGNDAAMLIATEPAQDEAGRSILKGQRDIILNLSQ